ncbi:MAG: hypothetical protein QOH37_3516, partial [Nocardioidaceae bacterium]|nr:hypothetical protein [Nocardioidaceae bacterium]
VVTTAHEAGLPVLAHAHSLAGARLAVAAGVDGLEHGTCLTPAGPEFPDDLLEDLARRDIPVCLTTALDRALVGTATPPPTMQAALARMGLTQQELLERRLVGAARMHRAGVRLVNGVDAGAVPPKPHGLAWRGVADLVEAGIPVAVALATATSGAADALGFGGSTGRLLPSYDADLLVVHGDVESDPTALAHVAAVVVRGFPLP